MSNFVLDIIKAVRQLASASPATTGDRTKPSPGCLADTPAGALEAKLPRGVPPLSEGVAVDLVEGFLEWGVRYLLDNLARALDNAAFAPLVEELQASRVNRDDCCVWAALLACCNSGVSAMLFDDAVASRCLCIVPPQFWSTPCLLIARVRLQFFIESDENAPPDKSVGTT